MVISWIWLFQKPKYDKIVKIFDTNYPTKFGHFIFGHFIYGCFFTPIVITIANASKYVFVQTISLIKIIIRVVHFATSLQKLLYVTCWAWVVNVHDVNSALTNPITQLVA